MHLPQHDSYSDGYLRRILGSLINEPAAAVVSGLPLFTKPLRVRLRLLFEAFALMAPAAPFVARDLPFQFRPEYRPDPRDGVPDEPSMRIWFRTVDRLPDDERGQVPR